MQIEFVGPECNSDEASLKQETTINFLSETNTFVPSSATLVIDGNIAFSGETFQCGFGGGWADGYSDGYFYSLNISPLTSYSALRTIELSAYGLDAVEGATENCSFITECSNCLANITIEPIYGSGVYYTNDLDPNSTAELLWNSSTTNIRIVDDFINDWQELRTNNNTYVVLGTDGGTSVVKNCISSLCYGGDGYDTCFNGTVGTIIDGYGMLLDGYCSSYIASSVHMDRLTNLYILNSTANQVEVFYGIGNDIIGRSDPDYIYGVDGYNVINHLHVVEYFSEADDGSNSLFLSTNEGVIRIDADESSPGISESDMIISSYGVSGSMTTYDVLGGAEDRALMSTYDRETYLLAIVTENFITEEGGVSLVDLRVNALAAYYSGTQSVENIEFNSGS